MNDAEAPTSSSQPAPYMTDLGPVDPAAHPDVDCASLTPIDASGPPLSALLTAIADGVSGLGFPGGMSNAMLVGGAHTDTGAPIAVFGPQTAYFMPQILVEKDGNRLRARVIVAGARVYVVLVGGPQDHVHSQGATEFLDSFELAR